MSSPGLTPNQFSPAQADQSKALDSDTDQERDRPPAPAKSPSELLSGVYRGFKKFAPSRDDSLRRQPSLLGLRSTTPTSSASSPSPTTDARSPPPPPIVQHARSLSLQSSLAKPLPEPPPEQSEADSFPAPAAASSIANNLDAIPEDLPVMADSRTSTMDSNVTGPASAGPSPSVAQTRGPAVATSASSSSAHLSGLMCNVHRTTGKEPHPLVGATTTILGDKLYVFGGRILSRSRPAPLTADLYELDLIRRHWTRLETTGDIPPPRYFHSMCPLGDTKMVCYGGMSPTRIRLAQRKISSPSRKWTYIPTQDPPQGRYAHCACILPSSASFSSHKAPLSALQHNPPSANPNEGRIGINIDGSGGAEMIIVGGQDGANHYIEQISVFNLRSLKWTSTQSLGKSCGAYRSVVAPLPPSVTSKIGKAGVNGSQREGGISQEAREPGSSMLIYSNYNFLDVKLELQIRSSDGSLSEKPMSGAYSPPGLRFPNGGVIDTHFVVSGTYLTSSKQEYALWALDLRTLTWSRIDAGGQCVQPRQLEPRLVDDYNHRRINFSNVCMVELEAFGFYDNPRKTAPLSGFVSSSSPFTGPDLSLARKAGCTAGGRFHSRASEELGEKALALRELSDMDILCLHGERIPVNSRIVARRWGPYFVQLLREGAATQDGSDAMTLRGGLSNTVRNSGVTITPSRDRVESITSMGSTIASSFGSSGKQPSTAPSSIAGGAFLPQTGLDANNPNAAPTPISLPPRSRPRCLYLPHTYLTVQALLHFVYTSSLPAPSSPLCTPPILCSLLQIARPYRIDGLLEAVVERLHVLLDSRNAAAVFNATAMAAGGGRGIDGSLNPNFFVPPVDLIASLESAPASEASRDSDNNSEAHNAALRLNTTVQQQSSRPGSGELSATTSQSGSEWSSEIGESEGGGVREIWSGELSSVIGLQKRGLRGLMEGRRMRERTGTGTGSVSQYGPQSRVGLGIASS
ncbi:ral2 [Verticillium alfalfae VaMs.102]|uniref:Ral2 n=1 Tax=Verticillium alfalfae (strain VaMs.102 / ATCC MYA-4576 / FGSC 10136) TaxID=526221 RepID=C9SQ71_VERA1|nr:ral2 [Verticillium alfalfae VaMs.102]EEY20996.1 ral2 [Verticillium alfalfae VaMs.102]